MSNPEIDFFDSIAPRWDADEVVSVPERINPLLDLLTWRPAMRVLDLGTGTGVLLPYLSARTAPGGSILAVDFSQGMLAEARRKFEALPSVSFLRADFEADAIPGTFHLVMLYSVYPHLKQPRATLRRLLDSNVAPGGSIVVAFPVSESFINSIHGQKKAPADLLPPAGELAARFRSWGFSAEALASSPEAYMVRIIKE